MITRMALNLYALVVNHPFFVAVAVAVAVAAEYHEDDDNDWNVGLRY